MLDSSFGKRFLKDCVLQVKRRKSLDKLDEIMARIVLEEPLPPQCRPHILSGTYEGFWECHIENDWVLIYRYDDDEAKTKVTFHRNGTHADLL